ncbi:hypothetical protein BDV26DRAFT_259711 [Aspergillus bertholletiae]|uniref:Uncharacterized protein n=1 Tax=Aspergillus bertholletiae TaxID=1226010 RepID=A0A5N7BC87_9EURO|nr:hypothetical protein BDV26DRAFT_259711 [Aspergillus bertholletiae]
MTLTKLGKRRIGVTSITVIFARLMTIRLSLCVVGFIILGGDGYIYWLSPSKTLENSVFPCLVEHIG